MLMTTPLRQILLERLLLNNYFNRIVQMRNSMPLDIRLSPSCEVFKSGIKKFLSEE